MTKPDYHEDTDVVIREEKKVKRPKKFKVILFNDDYTTMEFVIFVLQTVFNKSFDQAHALMWAIHTLGFGVAGVHTREVAESKVNQVLDLARSNEYPLKCTMEEE